MTLTDGQYRPKFGFHELPRAPVQGTPQPIQLSGP